MSSLDFSAGSMTPVLPTDLLSNSTSGLSSSGLSQEQKIKAVSKAMEGIFTSQLMSEMGKGLGGTSESQETGMYQDFIQQALAQGVTAGGGFGLAKFLETSLSPAKHEAPGATATLHNPYHVPGSH